MEQCTLKCSDYSTDKWYSVILGTAYSEVYKCWGLLKESELETAIMQAVVTYKQYMTM